jgi:23S rRNA (cytidine1920-2'-O)/16S rRNA (cytidine1409-2'-O)-methyltransferase
VLEVLREAAALGLGTLGVVASPLPGPSGNVEYFAWLRRCGGEADPARLEPMVSTAIREGPS